MKTLLPIALALSLLCACQAARNPSQSSEAAAAPAKTSDGQACVQSAARFPFGKELTHSGETVSWTIVIKKLSGNEYEVTGTVYPHDKSDLVYWGHARQKLMVFCNNELVDEFYVKAHMRSSKNAHLSARFTTDKPFNQVFLRLGGTLYMRP
jgi:hypothetical protein